MFEQARISRKITRISITIETEIGICWKEVDLLGEQISSTNRSLSETSKNQSILVSEPANRKAVLKQVLEVHAKAIEGWMLTLQWEHEQAISDKALRRKTKQVKLVNGK